MDEIELLVAQTFQHFNQNFLSEERAQEGFIFNAQSEVEVESEVREEEPQDYLPEEPGVLYHIQKSTSIFVIRTFVSQNIKEDYQKIIDAPEDYPSLRLLEGSDEDVSKKLRFFLVENPGQAEIIHDQLNNRRFPVHEEMMCNISDPGFSWWLTTRGEGFQLSFTMSVSSSESTVKLGPLGDQQLALKNFRKLETMITEAGLALNIQNEMSRVQFTEGEEFLMEELKDLFQFGVVSESMQDLFKLLNKSVGDHSTLEMSWFYLQELAAMRRFWIQIQYDLGLA